MKKLKHGINTGLTNSEYHGDKTWLSSTQLKKLLDSPKQFHDELIGVAEPKLWNSTALEDGSLTHSMILEPHLLNSEYVFWNGWTKRGKEYEEIVKKNPGKTVISSPQKHRVETFVKAYKSRKEAVHLLSKGVPELSIATTLMGVQVKMRADWINMEDGYIADIKTTGYSVEIAVFKDTVKNLKYQLSGALYCMIAEDVLNKNFDFYFIAISKKDLICEVFKLGPQSMSEGKSMVTKALKLYKECVDSGTWSEIPKKLVVPDDSDYEIHEV